MSNLNRYDALFFRQNIPEHIQKIYYSRHYPFIAPTEVPNMVYCTTEVNRNIEQLKAFINVDIPNQLAYSGKRRVDAIVKLMNNSIDSARSQITECSSMFLILQSNFKDVNSKFEQTRNYSHYHMPRGTKAYHYVLTHIAPIDIVSNVDEEFAYECFESQQTQFNNYEDLIMHYRMIDAATNKMQTARRIKFHSTKTLELQFEGYRLFHSVENVTPNLFAIIVFNDAELKTIPNNFISERFVNE